MHGCVTHFSACLLHIAIHLETTERNVITKCLPQTGYLKDITKLPAEQKSSGQGSYQSHRHSLLSLVRSLGDFDDLKYSEHTLEHSFFSGKSV